MPIVINGQRIVIPDVESGCYLDNPKYTFTDKKDFGIRASKVQSICIHTRMGIWPQTFTDVGKDRDWDEIGVKNASNDDRIASWHISVDADGSYVSHLDAVKHKAYHCGQCNDTSIGIELYQDSLGGISLPTLATGVKLVDTLTRQLGIQRQYATERMISPRFARGTKGKDAAADRAYLPGGKSGADFVGVFGHRNATTNRGKGDPGDKIFEMLAAAGYEGFEVDKNQDLEAWKARQVALGIQATGVAGMETVTALKAAGKPHGLWVARPGD
jgi:hypothetical protein